MEVEAAKMLAAGICMGIGAVGPAIGEGLVAAKTMEAISRNPSLENSLFPKMVIAMAICESTGIYSLLVSLIILFA